jgi:hypothetical protein
VTVEELAIALATITFVAVFWLVVDLLAGTGRSGGYQPIASPGGSGPKGSPPRGGTGVVAPRS